MIELVLSICLIAEPSRCKDVHLTFMEGADTPHACMMNGQTEIAKWMDSHPDWRVAKWGCRRPGLMAKA
jgi:hypothetical protein